MSDAAASLWVPATLEAVLLIMAGGFGVVWLVLLKVKRGAERSRRLLFLAFASLLALLLGRTWFIEPFYVPSSSMVPSLHVGDVLLVQKFPYRLAWPVTGNPMWFTGRPVRGDIVVFTLVAQPDVRYVKRVMGVPGDEVVHWQGEWFVNGRPLGHKTRPVGTFEGLGQGEGVAGKRAWPEALAGRRYLVMDDVPAPARRWVVPKGQLFVLGDNRGMSRDSREFGFVEEARVVGRVGRVLWNLENPSIWARAVGDDTPGRLR